MNKKRKNSNKNKLISKDYIYDSEHIESKKKKIKDSNERITQIPEIEGTFEKPSISSKIFESPSKNNDNSENETQDFYELPSIRDNIEIDPSFISEEPLHNLIPKLRPLEEEDNEVLKEQNLIIRNGRFTTIENAILKRNWDRYLKDYNIPNTALLLGHFQYERPNENDRKLKKTYRRFARDTFLWLRLAKDLPNRTIYQIYCRARCLLSSLKRGKDFNENDRQIILDLHRKHGDHYTTFCEEYGYNPKCAREIVRNAIKANGKQLKRGEWSYKEMRKLKNIVENLVKELKLESFDGIPWSRVAKKLKRSDVQCRQRFFSKAIFTMVSTNEQINFDNKLDLAKFIALLKHLNYADQNLIDWDYIKEKFSSNFFNILLRKWRELRVRVPDYNELSLPQIVDYLYEKRVLKYFKDNPDKMKEIENFIKS